MKIEIASNFGKGFAALDRLVKSQEAALLGSITDATNAIKNDWRTQIRANFKGTRLPNTVRSKVFKNNGLTPAGIVYSRAPEIMESHSAGALIVPKGGSYIVLPTPNVPISSYQTQFTPENWPVDRFGKLAFVPPRGGKPAMLVAKGWKAKKSRKTGKVSGYRPIKAKKEIWSSQDVIMFILVKRVQLKKRLNIPAIVQKHTQNMPAFFEAQLKG